MFVFMRLFRYAVFAAISFSIIRMALQHYPFYAFSPAEVAKASTVCHGKLPSACLYQLNRDLFSRYRGSIGPPIHWHTMHASMGSQEAWFLHLSFTEYLAVVGSPIAVEGHSGMFWMNQTCVVLHGSVARYRLTETKELRTLRRSETAVGGTFSLDEFDTALHSHEPNTYMLCYGRGIVPLSGSPFLARAVLAGDLKGASLLVFDFFRMWFHELVMLAQETWEKFRR